MGGRAGGKSKDVGGGNYESNKFGGIECKPNPSGRGDEYKPNRLGGRVNWGVRGGGG